MSDPLIRFRDVSKEFTRPDGVGTFTAVDRLSFTIEKGEIVAVLGKTGCGKSTMFNLLAGLIEPTSGEVAVSGHNPFLIFLQGIPALSWVIVAIIWFHGTEFRIAFIMIITTLPAFTFQVLDSYRSMSKDLFEMTMSFRPSGWTLFRVLIVPTIVPGILTAWKVNLGNAARVVVVAELVGATGGVGYQLLRQQQLFDMAGAIAWTLQLVLFVLIVQQTIVAIENHALRYRAVSERAM